MMYYEFLLQLFALHWKRHLVVLLLFTVLVWLLSSLLMMGETVRQQGLLSLSGQPDLIVQRVRGGRGVSVPLEWEERLSDIPGVFMAKGRVYGYYDFETANTRFLLAGLNHFEPESMADLSLVSEELDLKTFFAEPSILVGGGVKEVLASHAYHEEMNFILPSGNLLRMKIAGELPKELRQLGDDTILLSAPYARELLGLKDSETTDIALFIPNEGERLLIASKVRLLYPDARVIEKGYLQSRFIKFVDYKSGLFLALFTTTIAAFFILLFHKAGALTPHEKQEVAILRATGWSVQDVIALKLFEGLLIALLAFMFGFILAFGWVYGLGAPIFAEIMLGGENLPSTFVLTPHLTPHLIASIFLFSVIPFMLAVVYPAWRAAVGDIHEGLR